MTVPVDRVSEHADSHVNAVFVLGCLVVLGGPQAETLLGGFAHTPPADRVPEFLSVSFRRPGQFGQS